MKYFIDTEFIESGPHKPVTLISIGIVAGDGREYYAVSNEFNPDDANDWVVSNVLPHIGNSEKKSLERIAAEIFAFVSFDAKGVDRVSTSLEATSTSLSASIGQINTAAGNVGTLAKGVDDSLNGKSGLINKIGNGVDQITGQNGVVDHLNQTIGELHSAAVDTRTRVTGKDGLLDDAGSAIRDVRVNLVQVSRAQTKYYTEDAPQMTKLITDADKLLANPFLLETFENMADTSQHVDHIALHVDNMAADFEGSLHSHLHPTRKALFFGGLWQAAKIAATHVP